VLTLGVLAEIERLLRQRHQDPSLLLCDYFDLIAGTSTGAIIAAAFAKGMSVAQVQDLYTELASTIFQKTLFRQGVLRAKYDAAALSNILQKVFGAETLGSDQLKTGLLVMMKRVDTGSPWPVSNNPNGKYYDPKKQLTIANKDYPLWSVVRASTAAPHYFDPEFIRIADAEDGTSVNGTFVDGGVSTANNPSLLALRFATLAGYRVNWETGIDKLLLISVGTGAQNPNRVVSSIVGVAALNALLGLMEDCNAEVETMMQWLGLTNTGRTIDREIGDLSADRFASGKLLTYQRYNVELSRNELNELGVDLTPDQIADVQEMDAPENVPLLAKIGSKLGKSAIDAHFPTAFDRGAQQ
jgi:predicted acylesterase/phospholipase RssA